MGRRENDRRSGRDENGRRKSGGNRVETYRVALTRAEVAELRDLLRDVDGEADEDVLDDVKDALGRGHKRELDPMDRLVLRFTREEKDACRRAIDAAEHTGDASLIHEALRKLDLAIAKPQTQQ